LADSCQLTALSQSSQNDRLRRAIAAFANGRPSSWKRVRRANSGFGEIDINHSPPNARDNADMSALSSGHLILASYYWVM
jgi:hypothetical protein